MNFKAVIKGTVLSLILSVFFLLCGAALIYFNVLDEKIVSIIVFAGIVVSCFIGALGTAKVSDSKILINALSVGAFFCLILLIVSVIINDGLSIHTRTGALMSSIIAISVLGALFGK